MLRRFAKGEDHADGEAALALSVRRIRQVLGPRVRDPQFVKAYRLTRKQVAALVGTQAGPVWDSGYDHFLLAEVRPEHAREYYASLTKPSAPPEKLPARLGRIVHLRPARGVTRWMAIGGRVKPVGARRRKNTRPEATGIKQHGSHDRGRPTRLRGLEARRLG